MSDWIYPDGLVFREGMWVSWQSRDRGQRVGVVQSVDRRRGETYLRVGVSRGPCSVFVRAAICEPEDPAAAGGILFPPPPGADGREGE